ncbi:hypothetical protein OIU84_011617 [Salix udensis]|uniref:Uncharacterized protein n=1 Tax=Salix udensis TaxID=889485 RepID=A0AAD6JPS5_9ROSI|nr:hypothetical protein OIU84_011617 [Salix udensis]
MSFVHQHSTPVSFSSSSHLLADSTITIIPWKIQALCCPRRQKTRWSIVETLIRDFEWTITLQSTLVLLSMFFDAQQMFVTWNCINNGTCNFSTKISDISSLPGPGMETLTRQSYQIGILNVQAPSFCRHHFEVDWAVHQLEQVLLFYALKKVRSKWRGQMGSIAGISCFRDIIVARNTALSMVRQELVLGAVSSPVLISAGRSYLGSVMREFGLVILYCSVFAFCLPEIRGVTLCDTMDEHKEKDQLAM